MDTLMRLIPLHDKVLVRPCASHEVTKTGIAIPETTQDRERPQMGYVIAVNKGQTKTPAGIPITENGMPSFIPSDFVEGEIVFWPRQVGMTVMIEGERFLMLNEDQIIGKITLDRQTEQEREEFVEATKNPAG